MASNLLMILLIAVIVYLLISGYSMFVPLIVSTVVLIKINAPALSLTMVIQQFVEGVSTYVLLSIPLFVFAADIMTYGKTATRLVDFVKAFVGHIHGGLAITVAGACTMFGAISGSGNATVVAIGKPMRGKMIESGYDETNTDALICSAATIAALIPPSINMIMYSVMTGTSVGEMFLAGIFPGILMFVIFAVMNYFHAKKNNIPRSDRMSWRDRLKVVRKSLLALGFPVLVVGGIYSGLFSPTEAAAMSVFYAVICEMVIYRTVKIKDLVKIALSSAVMTATIFILIAVGQGFSWIIAFLQIPQLLAGALIGSSASVIKICLIISLFFLVACMFVDQIVAMLILLPILFPIAQTAGIDPIYLGVLVCFQSALGFVTPPFGSNIFVACAAFDRPYGKVIKGLPKYLLAFLIVSILYLVFPKLAFVYRIFQ